MTRIDLLSNPMTTAEDIIVGGASGVPERLAAGSEGDVLTIDSGVVAWAAPSGAEFATQVAKVATSQSTSSTSATDLATVGPSVTVTVPASGQVKVTIKAKMAQTVGTNASYCGFVVSGANTIAYDDYLQGVGGGFFQASTTTILTGLSTGSTTFKMQYRASSAGGGNQSSFANREIIVEPVL